MVFDKDVVLVTPIFLNVTNTIIILTVGICDTGLLSRLPGVPPQPFIFILLFKIVNFFVGDGGEM